MLSYMKCIKTGCDIKCDGVIYHGDLMYKDGICVLSGVPKDVYAHEGKYHFKCEELSEIPGTGRDYNVFLVLGKISEIDENLLKTLKEWESSEVLMYFE